MGSIDLAHAALAKQAGDLVVGEGLTDQSWTPWPGGPTSLWCAGDRVNLEADIIGKYVEKLLGKDKAGPGLMDLLKQEGFTND